MNIFLKVLKELIGTELISSANKQTTKSQSFFHTCPLSKDQATIIKDLNTDIVRFDGTNNDESDMHSILAMISKALVKVGIARVKHKASKNGETTKTLGNLVSYLPEVYKKLVSFKFKLLDKPFTQTPEGIAYLHAGLYLGEEIFNPMKRIDQTIRAEKEECLANRLQLLSELIHPTDSFEHRKTRTLGVLDDLASDNEKIIDNANASNYIPVSLVGGVLNANITLTDVLGYRLGRFDAQFSEAYRKIDDMTEKTFDFTVISKIENKEKIEMAF